MGQDTPRSTSAAWINSLTNCELPITHCELLAGKRLPGLSTLPKRCLFQVVLPTQYRAALKHGPWTSLSHEPASLPPALSHVARIPLLSLRVSKTFSHIPSPGYGLTTWLLSTPVPGPLGCALPLAIGHHPSSATQSSCGFHHYHTSHRPVAPLPTVPLGASWLCNPC
jgi:hypothetical protein